MCGICGIMGKADRPTVEAMVAALAHRGPDGGGALVRDGVALGHRRLAIIDLTTGQQPMETPDGRLTVTFNGEIYNFRELRRELEARGCRFRTQSDTETILHAYDAWGDRCVERFRGMFAFAILDTGNRRLFLARDQLGIKPLYYLHDRGMFAFASEIQALRRVPGATFTLDLEAVDHYLRLQYIPAPETVFREVRKLPPAHRMAVSLDGRLTGPEEYWRLDFRPDPRPTEDEWIEELDATLRDSVRAHLVSDVPFGAFLSGGTDSSAVVAYMAQLLDRPVRTFTIGFEEEEASEAAWAEQGARRWGTEHHVEVVRPQALDILPDLVRHYGEPFGDSSAIPTYYVSRMARRHVPMVLSGDGGDEAFAGYPTYRGWMQWVRRRLAPPPRSAWRALLRPVARRLMPWRYPTPEGTASLEGWLGRVQYLSAEQRRALWRPEFRRVMRSPLALFEAEYARGRDWSLCSRVQYLDIKTYLPCDILTKVDVASMMHGLEVRTPLVDARVMELAARIPEPLAMAQDADGGWTGKRLLKRLLERYYPPEYVRRPKMGFSMPVQRWFAAGGALRGMVQEQLLARGALLHEFFDPAGIRPLIEANEHGPVWLMLFLEEWLRQNRSQVSA